jgi:hypothetical protein
MSLEKDHDYHSMRAVMDLLAANDPAWERSKKYAAEGQLEKPEKELAEKQRSYRYGNHIGRNWRQICSERTPLRRNRV